MEEVIKEHNRWEIKKIGLLNYWWYDEEEFKFSEGRLILRGTNGSGKSVTMQSFIPLLLDGNKSPERLDPFNTKARKIEDYVLGYGDNIKEENTSYLYMEFQKKETKNYISIGMGLQAKKNKGVKFWGFIIKDGRRIGKDFFLYKDLGNKIPLSKQELKNRIGEGGQVVENQKEYAMLVNDNIFGFETLAEYQEFIKLLIEIRTPKLSKDGFKPSIITEIMSNSLRGLSDEDLRSVSESIENMNKTKEQLEHLKNSQKALKQILIPYYNYNKCVLFNKAKNYDEKQRKYKKLQKESSELIQKINNAYKDYNETKNKKQDIEIEIKKYEYKKKGLESNELWKQKEIQHDLENQIEETKQDLKNKEKVEEDKKTLIRKKELEENDTKIKYEEQKSNFSEIITQMEQKAKDINYDEFFFKMDEINIEQSYNYKYFKEDIKRYIQKIENGKKALENENIVNNEYEIALENLDKEKNNKNIQDAQTNKVRNKLEEVKENFIENMYTWERENIILKLEKEELTKIAQKVQNYGEISEYDDIIMELHKPYDEKKQKISDEKAMYNSQKNNIEVKINESQNELIKWKNKKEPEPTRSEKVIQNRQNLKEKGIPYIEFYNAVDFKKELNEEQKNRIENALLDMGILDALIIPKEYISKIKEIDCDFTDKYLFENPVEFKHDLSYFLDVKLPEKTKIKQETVVNILKSIMIAEKSAHTYINEQGEYKIGILEGIADKKQKAKYIGNEARKRFKEKIIKELEEEIIALNDEKTNIENQINELELNAQKLREEYDKFPNKQELEENYKELKININKLTSINQNIKKLEDILTEKFEKLKQAKEQTQIATKNLSFAHTIQSYEEGLEVVNSLKEDVFEMEKYHNNTINEHEKLLGIKDNLENLRYDLDDILYEKGKLNVKLKDIQEKVKVIKQMSEGIEKLDKQMEEVLEKLDKLPKEKELLDKNIGKTEAMIETLKEKQLTIGENLNNFEKQTNIAKEILEQELNLKYVIEEDDEISKITSRILSEYSYFDKETKSKEDYRAILIEKYKDNNENLLDYNLSIGEIFVQEILSKDSEQIRIEQTRTRSDIACFVNGKKVNIVQLEEHIEEIIEETASLVDEKDRDLYEDILVGTVGRKIRERIYFAKDWVESMNKLMKSLNTSSGLSFSLNWKPKLATTEEELDTKQIVEILNSEIGLLKKEDIQKVSKHFRAKFKMAEKEYQEKDTVVPFYNIIKETLDYRKWFEFQFMYRKSGEQSKELTNNAFYKLSGGEKAMAMYIPLFASVCARYQSARKDCLRIISLDEAFAGVDDNNIRDMFRILTELDLEYVINSQVLWGEYDTVPNLSICELISDVNNKVVSIMRYHWNGKKRELVI